MSPHRLPNSSTDNQRGSLQRTNTSPSSSASSAGKTIKGTHRNPKRAGSNAASSHHHDHLTQATSTLDGRHKRVWKACERCRMKKTKCDGEFPCKRCKDDGLVCTAGLRKRVEYKQLPRGYAEVIENTQLALIATVHKLYSMVRKGESWNLGDPDTNERGQPVIHNIAEKLGCIRPNSDIDLPVHSVFPEDEAGMVELAAQLEGQQQRNEEPRKLSKDSDSSLPYSLHDSANSSDYNSDFEADYRRLAFSRGLIGPATALPPPRIGTSSSSSNKAFDNLGVPAREMESSVAAGLFPVPSPSMNMYSTWANQPNSGMNFQFPPPQSSNAINNGNSNNNTNMDVLSQNLAANSFGTLKAPTPMSSVSFDAMMGFNDPVMYEGNGDRDDMLL